MDFFCHGGIAILAPGCTLQLSGWSQVRGLPWLANVLAPVSPGRLERPPKPFATA
jgi:hypothetical protein